MILESERRAIVETLVRYCTALDTGAWKLLGDVFLPNARVDYTGAGGPVLSGAEAERWLAEEMARFKILQHFLSNVCVTQDGDEVRSTAVGQRFVLKSCDPLPSRVVTPEASQETEQVLQALSSLR